MERGISFSDMVKYNTVYKTYGKVIKIQSKYIKLLFVVLCVVTPCTNWLIPIFYNKIKDIVVRYSTT